ncbi:hypothetical protein ACFT1A_30530 [Rhodococcus sp. NPDC057135]|uniref:hypothetical protein n=1 Tax=Rhodococcus sp. NPDC057135 TaxID=3346028 RepID=UPI00363FDF26
MTTAYLDALERQSRVVAECVGDGMIGLGCGSGSCNTGGGMACSDSVGPAFFSDSVRRDMADSEAK